jgi:hypothetical protein
LFLHCMASLEQHDDPLGLEIAIGKSKVNAAAAWEEMAQCAETEAPPGEVVPVVTSVVDGNSTDAPPAPPQLQRSPSSAYRARIYDELERSYAEVFVYSFICLTARSLPHSTTTLLKTIGAMRFEPCEGLKERHAYKGQSSIATKGDALKGQGLYLKHLFGFLNRCPSDHIIYSEVTRYTSKTPWV